MSPSSTEEIRQKWKCSLPLQRKVLWLLFFFGKHSRYKSLFYDFCLNWKRILMTLSSKKFRCHPTSTWPSGTTSTRTFPDDQTTKHEQATRRRIWLTRPPRLSLWLPPVRMQRRQRVFFPSELRSFPDLSRQIISSIPTFTTDTVQSLRPVGLSSWHPHSMCPVLRRVCKTLSFSPVWCRCELLTTPHLFSLLFWKRKALRWPPYL